MMRTYIILASMGLVFGLSCNAASNLPITPQPETEHAQRIGLDGAFLWGLWEILIDPDNLTAEIVPLRGAGFTCNVVRFIDGPPSNLVLTIGTVDIQPNYKDIPIDIGIRHPFPGMGTLTGFDVMGVFMGNGSGVYPGPESFAIPTESDQRLLNPDGYTRWFNAPEFGGVTKPIFSYYPGHLGTAGFVPYAELNGYKYFADALDKDESAFDFLVSNADDRGCFRPGSLNTRDYDIRFPNQAGIKFQYAIVAHWEPAGISNPEPGDFPLEANADESVVLSVADTSTLWYVDDTNNGGKVRLDISPYDWSATCLSSGAMEEYEIKCYSPAWDGPYMVDMTPESSGVNNYTYHAEIPADALHSTSPVPVWIEVNYPDLDYSNEFGIINNADGPLAGYFLLNVPVSDVAPPITVLVPNGGEKWKVGSDEDILWEPGSVAGTVFIEYSTDNFVSDINLIAVDQPNDGSFQWWGIPCDISNSVRVRISSTDNPSLTDSSDADFSIFGAGGAMTWGSTDDDMSCSLAIDSGGNIYVVGDFQGAVDFDPGDGVDTHASVGKHDAFLSKFDSCGEFLWSRTWGGPGYDAGFLVDVDDSGNITVIGRFEVTVDFNPGPGTDEHTSNGGWDIFLSKFDLDGNYKGVVTWGGTQNDFEASVAIDGSGYAYATGRFQGTVDFDPGGGIENHSSNGLEDAFLIKFNSTGELQWVRTWGGPGWDYSIGVDLDGYGNIYVSGSFEDTADLDPGPGVDEHISEGEADAYLSAFNSSGDFSWAKSWGGLDYVRGGSLRAGNAGEVYIGGIFYGTVDFDPGAGVDERTSGGSSDVYISKFDSSGAFQWVRAWGGSGQDEGWSLDLDGDGNIFMAGYFQGDVDFDPGPPTYMRTANGWGDIYISKLDLSGTFQWVRTWGSFYAATGEEARAVAIDPFGGIHLVGRFYGTADFAPTDPPCNAAPDAHESNGLGDAFLSAFTSDGCW